MKKLVLMTITSLLTTLTAHADIDDGAAAAGAFDVDFTACSSQNHQVLVHLAMTSYSPVDTPPAGYAQAATDEVQTAAVVVFPANFAEPFARDNDALISAPGYLSDISFEEVEVQDEGKTVTTTRTNKAMNEVKEILMKSQKYSGMGLNFLESTVTLKADVACGTGAQ